MNNLNFDFYCPTRIYFRNEGVSQIGNIIKENFEKYFYKIDSGVRSSPPSLECRLMLAV